MMVAPTAPSVRLFGPPTFIVGDKVTVFPADKRHQLLAYLAYQGEWVRRESLAELFWPGSPETARGNLRRLLGRVQDLPWLTGLEIERTRVRWLVRTDVVTFQDALRAHDHKSAVALYVGPLLHDIEGYDDNDFLKWLEVERATLSSRWRDSMLEHVQGIRGNGFTENVFTLLRTLLKHEPFDEEALQLYLTCALEVRHIQPALEIYESFEKRLNLELGITPSSKTLQLVQETRAQLTQDSEAVNIYPSSVRSPVSIIEQPLSSNSLPAPITSFIGRDLELAEIYNLLLEPICRVLTITGPGGIGKTRLALQAAIELAPRFQDGAYFVNLAPLTSPTAVLPQLAKTLGVATRSQEALSEAVQQYLRDKTVLIVIDNFEHVMDSHELVSELVSKCLRLTIIVTSRERLQIPEEHTLTLSGLALPDSTSTLADVQTFDGIRLFIDRAKRFQPTLAFGERETTAITRICTLVDGSPLGIELAASWTRAMSVTDISHAIGTSLDVLASSSRNVNDRQRSLRATFDYSWRLLSDKEQGLLTRLAIFRGGFSREAAFYVTESNIALLGALIDKSLLRFIPERYSFHPLIWQFAREKLADYPSQKVFRERHATFFARLAERTTVVGDEQIQALKDLEQDYPNILEALNWCDTNEKQDLGLQLCANLESFWVSRGFFDEGYRWLKSFTRKPSTSPQLLPALKAAGTLANKRADYAAAEIHFSQLLTAAQASNEPSFEIEAYNGLGMVSQAERNYERAHEHYERSLNLLQGAGNLPLLSVTLKNLANVSMEQRDFKKARQLYQDSMRYSQACGHQINLAIVMVNLGLAHYRLGDLSLATMQLQQALEFARALPYLPATIGALAFLGVIKIDIQALEEASVYLKESLTLCWKHHDQPGLAFSIENLASLLVIQNRPLDAATLWGAAESIRKSLKFSLEPSWRPRYEYFVAQAKSQEKPDAFHQAWLGGRMYLPREIVTWALSNT